MQLRNSLCTVALAVLGLFTVNSHAGSIDFISLNCGANDIEVGMTLAQIESSCDIEFKPSYVSEHTRPIPARLVKGDVTHDVFQKRMYAIPEQQTVHVILRNDVVVRIFAHKPRMD